MLKDSIIVMPSGNPWEWSADYVRQTAKRIAQKNTVVVFLWTDVYSLKELFLAKRRLKQIHSLTDSLYLFQSVHWIPFKRFAFVTRLNFILNLFLLKIFLFSLEKQKHPKRRILWTFEPYFTSMRRFFSSDFIFLYDCVDYYVDLRGVEKNIEAKLLAEADMVVANSTILKSHCQQFRSDVHLVSQGFDKEAYASYTFGKRSHGSKIVGYVGGINDRLDYDLIEQLALRNPTWQIILWGPVQGHNKNVWKRMKLFSKIKNIQIGQSPRNKLPDIVSDFTVGIIPYVDSDFNRNCYPMKLFEYFYMGKQVVSADILELRRFDELVTIASSLEEWEAALGRYFETEWPKELQKRQRTLALENTWESKINHITQLIENGTLQKK